MRPKFRRVNLALAALVVLVASACTWTPDGGEGSDLPLNTLDPKGDAARLIDNLVTPVFAIAGVVFVLVPAAVLYVALRYRRKSGAEGADDWPVQLHGNTKLELGWTILPAVVLAFVAVFTITTLFDLNDVPDDNAGFEVTVWGQQWWWSYDYDFDNDGTADLTTANDLVIPADTAVELTIRSRDVIHSFWIPPLNGKKDAVPGRGHSWWIEADEPGVYLGQCTEFCGLSHAKMRMRVVALEPAEFEAWKTNQLEPAAEISQGNEAAVRGREVFSQQCASCHLIRGVNDDTYQGAAVVSGAAPELTHLMSRSVFAGAIFELYDGDQQAANYLSKDGLTPNDGQLEAWIRNPQAQKPMAPDPNRASAVGRGMPTLPLTEDQIDDLVAYLTTLD